MFMLATNAHEFLIRVDSLLFRDVDRREYRFSHRALQRIDALARDAQEIL